MVVVNQARMLVLKELRKMNSSNCCRVSSSSSIETEDFAFVFFNFVKISINFKIYKSID